MSAAPARPARTAWPSRILAKAGADPQALRRQVDAAIAALPRLTGTANRARPWPRPWSRLLTQADEEAKSLNDEYVSVEHVLLALAADRGAAGKLLREAGVTAIRC